MKNYKMTVAYDGKHYKGFKQSKKDSPEKSIQGKLQNILKKLYEEKVEVIGAVNTDAGVHASHQIVNFKAPKNDFTPEYLLEYINEYLPNDIRVKSVELATDKFHSQLNAKALTYTYRLWKSDACEPYIFHRQYVYPMEKPLDFKAMREAANLIEGRHDFVAYTNKAKNKKTIKEIYNISIDEDENEYKISMTANSFLVNMERFIVGTLIQIGLGQKKINDIEASFYSGDAKYVGHKAMAHSLCLTDINYDDPDSIRF